MGIAASSLDQLNGCPPSKGGKVWVKINDKWREGETVSEGKGMTKWIMQQGKSNIALMPLKRLRATKRYYLLAQFYQTPERVKLYVC